ncbi:MAG: CRTAC1 family protein, partial [Bryobacteraceae bacterium]|nr:CRTAC1 family protein [Bryobacteraceae bacterium]
DYDNDGWLDILLLTGSRLPANPTNLKGGVATNRLYRNNRNGTFTDVTKRAGLERTMWASGVCVGDFDNDGSEDLFITGWGENVLYRNNGNGTFSDITREAGLIPAEPRWGAGATWIDYDRDGKLDLFVSNYLKFDLKTMPLPGARKDCNWKGLPVNCGPRGLELEVCSLYHNNGDGTFTDVSEKSGIVAAGRRFGMTSVVADFDDDGWQDLYVACDSTPSLLLRNLRDGKFADIGLESGTAVNEDGREQAGMGLAIGDTTGSGRIDIFKTHFADDTPVLYRNRGQGMFDDVTGRAGLAGLSRYVSWGAGMFDFDNDGHLDLLAVNGNVYPEIEEKLPEYPYRNPRVLLLNNGRGGFTDRSAEGGPGINARHSSRGAAFGDFDNDGDVDVLVMNMNELPSLLRADVPAANRWIKFKLVGTTSNRTAIGAKVTVTVGGRKQAQSVQSQSSFYSQNDLRLHFGLGTATQADSVEVRWPNGLKETYKSFKANQVVVLREGDASKTSG